MVVVSANTWSFLKQSVVSEVLVISVSKNSFGYDAIVRLKTEFETVLDTHVYLLSEVKLREKISVRYSRVIPSEVKSNSFFEIWLPTLLTILWFVFVSLLLYVINICRCWKSKRNKKLRQAGNHIYTTFKEVEAVFKVKKEGKSPYRIISTWHDRATEKVYYFKSDYIWGNPIDYILDKTITVIIDSKSKKKYVMDLGFLPEHIRL